MSATPQSRDRQDFRVADLSLAEWGRKEMAIAEGEMPALMAIRQEYATAKPLTGARIAGSLHMTIQTTVLIETLKALGAEVRWASCNIFSTQDHAAAAIAAGGTPVFAHKGESLDEYWQFSHRIFEFGDRGPNMILDDGGDATLLVHLGIKAEGESSVIANPKSEEETSLFESIRRRLAAQPGWYGKIGAEIRGVTEEPQVDHILFPGGKRIILLAEGRLVNLGCATGHPSYVMSSSFANQVLAQVELFTHPEHYPIGVYMLPKQLDEKVARLQLRRLAAQLTELTEEQASYIGVPKAGPYKPEHYRY